MPGPAAFRGEHTDHIDESLRTMPQNRTDSPRPFAHRGHGHRPWVTDARSPAPRAPPPACPRFFPAESAPNATRDKFSVWGGVSRGTGARGPGRCRVPIRSAHSPQESTQQGARRAPGAYRLCCGLACGDDARAPRHRASGPALRGRSARPRRHVSLFLTTFGRVSRDPNRPKTPTHRRARRPGPRAGGQTKHET